MEDSTPSSSHLWFVTLARDAFNEGHRVIAHHLNSVLRQRTRGVHINAAPMQAGDSLHHAPEQFRQTLPEVQTRSPLPPSDYNVKV